MAARRWTAKDEAELRELTREWNRRAKEWPVLRYKPTLPLLRFHKSRRRVRVAIGANRIGKSTAGAAEVVSVLRGLNRFRGIKYELPTHVWAIPLDTKKLGYVLKQRIRKFLPPGEYREWVNDGIFKLSKKFGGSELHVMSCEAGPDKFQGAGIDFAWFDEEPEPRGDEIFNEVYARVEPGRPLDIILTYTPLNGYSWSYKRFMDPTDEDYLRGHDGEEVVEVFQYALREFDTLVGGHLSTAEIERLEAAFPKHERMPRIFGQYSLIPGNPFHDIEFLDKAEKAAPEGKRQRIWIDSMKSTHLEDTDDTGWAIYRERKPYERYVIGVDIASGAHKDRSVAYVLKLADEKGPVALAARYRSDDIHAAKFAQERVYPMARYYNRAEIIPEINGEWGGAFITALLEVYSNVWNNLKWDRMKQRMTGEIGWRTGGTSRGVLHSLIARALEDGLPVFTKSVCREISTMVIKRDQKTEHAYGMYDDEYFALALALFVVYNEPPVIQQKVEEIGEQWEYQQPWQRGMR